MTELLYYTKPDGSVVVFKEGDRLLLSGEEYAVKASKIVKGLYAVKVKQSTSTNSMVDSAIIPAALLDTAVAAHEAWLALQTRRTTRHTKDEVVKMLEWHQEQVDGLQQKLGEQQAIVRQLKYELELIKKGG